MIGELRLFLGASSMSKLYKLHTCEWQDVEGIFSVIFVSRDASGRETRIAVPAAAIMTTIASDARRRVAARVKQGQQHNSTAGTWNRVGFLQAHGVELGITVDDNVGLILDPGKETEFALSIEPQLARELAMRLIETAEKAAVRKSTIN